MQLIQAFRRATQLRPGAPAIVFKDRVRSFRDLESRVAKLAGAMQQIGIREANSVAIVGNNSDRYLECMLAIPWLGASIAPLDRQLALPHVIKALNDSESIAIFLDDRLAIHVDELLEACPFLRYLIYFGDGSVPAYTKDLEALIAGAEPVAATRLADDEIFGVFQSRDAKQPGNATRLSQRNIGAAATALMIEGAIAEGAIGMNGGPLSEIEAIVMTAALLSRGATQVVRPQPGSMSMSDIIRKNGVTDLMASTTALGNLLSSAAAQSVASLDSILHVLNPIPAVDDLLLDKLRSLLPNANFLCFYGRDEHTAVATVRHRASTEPAEQLSAGGYPVGRAAHGLWIRVVGPDGRDLQRGQVGTLSVGGPTVMLGYLNAPEATAAVLKGSWLNTGELAMMDHDGVVHLVNAPVKSITDGNVTGDDTFDSENSAVTAERGRQEDGRARSPSDLLLAGT